MSLECSREMRLVRKPGDMRDLGQRPRTRGELIAGPFDPNSPDVLAGCASKFPAEDSRQVNRMHPRFSSECRKLRRSKPFFAKSLRRAPEPAGRSVGAAGPAIH